MLKTSCCLTSRGGRRGSCLNEYGAFHDRSTILKCRITAVSVLGEIVGQAFAPEAIAECIRNGGVWEAESNIDLLDLVSLRPRRTGMRRSRWNASISRKTLRKPPGGSASSTRCGKSRSFVRPTISRLRRVISSNPLRLRASLLGAAGHPDPAIREKSQFRAQHDSLSLSLRS